MDINRKWYKVWCGGFRHFQILANNKQHAQNRFGTLSRLGHTKGFTPDQVTHVTEQKENTVARLKLTYEICHAAAMDAGNASMRRALRSKWNEEDYNAASKKLNDLLDIMEKQP